MPAEIDLAERLDAIARATLEIAREHGSGGVTVRSVAARLGGSTTLVTKYVSSRPALLANAFRYVSENWGEDRAEALGQATDAKARLRALAGWSLTTTGYDDAIRRLWLEALADGNRGPASSDLPREQARAEHDEIRETVREAVGEGSDWLADALFLSFRGYYLSSIEDPERWPAERAGSAISRLLEEVLG